MLDITRIQGICFDVDGTLSDTDNEFVRRVSYWLSPINHLFPKWDSFSFARRVIMVSESPGTFFHVLPDRLGIDGKLAAIGDFLYQRGIGRAEKSFSLIPGVNEMLEMLSSRYLLSIISSRGKMSVQHFLNRFNLNDYFLNVVTSQTCKRVKPHPEPILWATKQMNLLPEQCLMVGDTSVDIIAGKTAGTQTVGVLCGFGEEKELLESGADLILETTPDLTKCLL